LSLDSLHYIFAYQQTDAASLCVRFVIFLLSEQRERELLELLRIAKVKTLCSTTGINIPNDWSSVNTHAERIYRFTGEVHAKIVKTLTVTFDIFFLFFVCFVLIDDSTTDDVSRRFCSVG
jgi:hypothetical protein